MNKRARAFEKSKIAAAHLEALGRRAPGILIGVKAHVASKGSQRSAARVAKEDCHTSSASDQDAAEDSQIDYSLSL